MWAAMKTIEFPVIALPYKVSFVVVVVVAAAVVLLIAKYTVAASDCCTDHQPH